MDLLRFDAQQAGFVLEARSGRRFAPEHVERLIQLTEGWPASVVLAGLALDWLDLDSLEQALADPRLKRDIYSYLAEQVYRNEGVATQRFLDRTCCLEHVTEKLANRLAGIDDAHRSLHHLTANRVFTFADEPGAYRYHNLFREYLRHNYVHEHGEAALRTLQRESAAALEDAGEIEMAVELLFNANEQPAALEVLARAGEPGLDNFRTESLVSWLQRLSREMRCDEPWARLLSSQVHMRAGDLDAALVDIDAAVSTCEAASDEWGLYHALSAKECVLVLEGGCGRRCSHVRGSPDSRVHRGADTAHPPQPCLSSHRPQGVEHGRFGIRSRRANQAAGVPRGAAPEQRHCVAWQRISEGTTRARGLNRPQSTSVVSPLLLPPAL